MSTDAFPARLGAGIAAGLAGTVLMESLMAGSQRWAPQAVPKMREDPAEYMLEQAESVLPESRRERIPPGAEAVVETALHFGYGTTFGVLYGLTASRGTDPLLAGTLLGLATWATGYLGWLPATGILPPVTRQEPLRVAAPIASHVVFGIATALAYRWIRRRLED